MSRKPVIWEERTTDDYSVTRQTTTESICRSFWVKIRHPTCENLTSHVRLLWLRSAERFRNTWQDGRRVEAHVTQKVRRFFHIERSEGLTKFGAFTLYPCMCCSYRSYYMYVALLLRMFYFPWSYVILGFYQIIFMINLDSAILLSVMKCCKFSSNQHTVKFRK